MRGVSGAPLLLSLTCVSGRAGCLRSARLPPILYRAPVIARSRSSSPALQASLQDDERDDGPTDDVFLPRREGLVLVDGHALAYRMHFALKDTDMKTMQGEATHALHGFCLKLLTFLEMWPDHHMLVCFDTPGPIRFRTELLPDYKSNRPSMPSSLRHQISAMLDASTLLGAPAVAETGYEADDLIAAWVGVAQAEGFKKVVIVSSDKDLLQLVSDDRDQPTDVLMWDDMKKRLVDADGVISKHGVPPSAMGDLLALMGDQSDNVPGIPGVGTKTAATLLQKHGTLEGVLQAAAAAQKPNAKQRALVDCAEVARRARQLVELNSDAPVDRGAIQGVPAQMDEEGLAAFLERWELRTVQRNLQSRDGKAAAKRAKAAKAAKTKEAAEMREAAAKMRLAETAASKQQKAKAAAEEAKDAAKKAAQARRAAESLAKAAAKAHKAAETAEKKAVQAEMKAEAKAEKAAAADKSAVAATMAVQGLQDALEESS
jgi:5'-3' exonuclease